MAKQTRYETYSLQKDYVLKKVMELRGLKEEHEHVGTIDDDFYTPEKWWKKKTQSQGNNITSPTGAIATHDESEILGRAVYYVALCVIVTLLLHWIRWLDDQWQPICTTVQFYTNKWLIVQQHAMLDFGIDNFPDVRPNYPSIIDSNYLCIFRRFEQMCPFVSFTT